MLFYDKQIYNELPINEEIINQIEKEKNIKCLFGAAFSAKVYGYDNSESDLDFYMIFKGERKSYSLLINELDLNMINYGY